ncbi:uncharacterized protein LOC111123251 [Crassostrea virginica]
MLLWCLGVLMVLGVSGQRPDGCLRIFDHDTCPSGYRCQDGQCRIDGGQPNRCSRGNPCPRSYTCVQGICVPTTSSGCLGCQFHPDVICENDRCVRRPGTMCGNQYEPCSAGYSCIRGVCSTRGGPGQCLTDVDCSRNERCSQRVCVPRVVDRCRYESDCSVNEQCVQGRCIPRVASPECRRDSDCLSGNCRMGSCVEVQPPNPNSCDPFRNRFCSRGYSCVNNQCVPNDQTECGPSRPCQRGYQCRLGRCVEDQIIRPTRCRYDGQCQSGYECVRRQCRPLYRP